MMTKDFMEKRMVEMKKAHERAVANVHVIAGQMQELEFLMKQSEENKISVVKEAKTAT